MTLLRPGRPDPRMEPSAPESFPPMSQKPKAHFRLETIDGITIVRVLDRENIREQTWSQLYSLVDQEGEPRWILLDFSKLKSLSSVAVGTLVRLHMKVASFQGALKICSVNRNLRELITHILR